MKITTRTCQTMIPVALAAILAAPPAFAELPTACQARNAHEIDSNKNGRIEKQEYLAFMSEQFDKLAGSTGYYEVAEQQTHRRSVWGSYQAPYPAL